MNSIKTSAFYLVLQVLFIFPITGNAQTGFINEYPSSGRQQPVAIAPARDGGMVVLATQLADSTNPNRQLMCIKYGPAGGVFWAFDYPISGDVYAANIHSLGEEGFLITGNITTGGNQLGVLVFRINENGNAVGGRIYATNLGPIHLSNSLVTATGKLWISGFLPGSTAPFDRGFFMSIDENTGAGTMFVSDSVCLQVNGITDDAQGNIVGNALMATPTGGRSLGFVKITPGGGLLQAKAYAFANGDVAPGDLLRLPSGGFSLSGKVPDNALRPAGLLMRADSAGTPVWNRTYSGHSAGPTTGRDLAATPNGKIFLQAHVSGDLGAFTGAILQFAGDGSPEWVLVDPTAMAMNQNDQGNILIAGKDTTDITNWTDVVGARFNPATFTSCIAPDSQPVLDSVTVGESSVSFTFSTLGFPATSILTSDSALAITQDFICQILVPTRAPFTEQETWRIYPNPANNNFSVVAPIGAQITVWDQTGRQVYRETRMIEGRFDPISVLDWPAGLYYVRMHTQNGLFQTKRLIVQH